ncbi:hypothetical protein DYB31_015535 [Aphanomyces astaci]|uniref:DDE-1 domain-containing protein n=1 Tax=Aphanomyces astaci TaxID=112090 RepID=A0A397EKP5_APHAT|nr:hypothetical protein DYB31_015535 [Aphanomyces astaci]
MLKRAELEEQKNAFAANFWEKHDEKPLRDIVNVDETAVYYDMPPRHTWCEIGEDAKVDSTEKHSDRLTAVLGACADGAELLKYELVGPSVLVVDNLATHVSYTSRRTVDEELYGFLEPLPPNTTSVSQPLDVGVMGPLKAKLRALCGFRRNR